MITQGIFKQIEKDTSKVVNTERYKSKSLTKDELEKIKEEIKKLSETQNTIKKEYKKKIINEAQYKQKIKQHTEANNTVRIEHYNKLLKPIENIKDELKDNESKLKDLKLKLDENVKSTLVKTERYLAKSRDKADDAYRDAMANAKQRFLID